MEFTDLLEYCKAEAIANRVSPTEVSVWRAICRSYSKMFHTPLQEVLNMAPEHVVLNVYEEQMEDADIDDYHKLQHLLDIVRGIEDPEYDAKQSREQEEFDKQAEKEEAERIKANKPVHPSLAKDLPKKTLSEPVDKDDKKLPTGGSVNLDYLSKQDSEG